MDDQWILNSIGLIRSGRYHIRADQEELPRVVQELEEEMSRRQTPQVEQVPKRRIRK